MRCCSLLPNQEEVREGEGDSDEEERKAILAEENLLQLEEAKKVHMWYTNTRLVV